MPTKTESIKLFLEASTHTDLAALYTHDMEVQVNAAQDGGIRVSNEYRGRSWHGFPDPSGEGPIWKSFRIPYKAKTDPEFADSKISWDLAAHAEGIGMTGWDWNRRVSRWVAFDFDSITGHSEAHQAKLTAEEMDAVKQAACALPFVTVRKSTGGNGLHLYVQLPSVPTANHNEHAALARAILGQMSALTGFDFRSKVDACGGNMWVWHRKMKGTDGLVILKSGSVLEDYPDNWADHIAVVSGRRRKNLPRFVEGDRQADFFEEICGQRAQVPIDPKHKELFAWLDKNKCQWWWDQDHWMLVAHTADLKSAHRELGMVGLFDTIAKGREHGADHNCFGFPVRHGAWTIRRYTPGVAEHSSWNQDGSGYTYCYLNREPDLVTAAAAKDAVEMEDNKGWEFMEAEIAADTVRTLGAEVAVPGVFRHRAAILKSTKDGRLLFMIKHESGDDGGLMKGWRVDGKFWKRVVNVKTKQPTEADVGNCDDIARHLVTPTGGDSGWVINAAGEWHTEPLPHIRSALRATGYSPTEIENIVGNSVMRPWTLVNEPFASEFPGDRRWNRDAAALKYQPQQDEPFHHPTWDKVLQHAGRGLDEAVKEDSWCQTYGLQTGADWLKVWVASLFQSPERHLPYLFFYSRDQNTGKSSFHDAISLLMTRGVKRADNALTNQSGFNGELAGAVLCVVEEVDLGHNKVAANRVKDWVTSEMLPVRAMYKQTYEIPNMTHWIQCANDPGYVPMFPGDTRIVVIKVPNLSPTEMIPKDDLKIKLAKEAEAFLGDIMATEIPPSGDRLAVRVIDTADKVVVQEANRDPVDQFLKEMCFRIDGESIKLSELWDQFYVWADAEVSNTMGKTKFTREVKLRLPYGRVMSKGAHFFVGNVSFTDVEATKPKLIVAGNRLVHDK